jgi:hypothetical protein
VKSLLKAMEKLVDQEQKCSTMEIFFLLFTVAYRDFFIKLKVRFGL